MAIVVDSSALAAIVLGEPDALLYAAALAAHAGDIRISAATAVEVKIVLQARQGVEAVRDLELLLTEVDADVVPFDARQAELAVAAWNRFGKGRHSAALNFGDCFSYALSKHLGAPLLYKRDDFSRTDVASAL